ncbi:hypothetical protein ACFLR1_02875 [Bacteroidota bacterium]
MTSKILKAAGIILGCALMLYCTEQVLQRTLRSCKVGTIGKINSVMNHDLDVEVTIWGASTAYVNFNPKILIDSLGYTCINMGIDGTPIDQYNGLLEEYLSYSINSKYVIIALDVHGGLVNRNRLYHLHNWLHHAGNQNIYNCLSDVDPRLMFKIRHVPFYDLTLYDKHSFPYFRKTILNRKTDYEFDNFGYKPSTIGSIDTSLIQSNTVRKKVLIIGERCLKKALTSSIKAKETNITPIIIVTPCFTKGLDKLTGLDDFLTAINSLKKSGIQVFDLSSCYISKDPKYFSDNTHLSSVGADELTRLLANKIKNLESQEIRFVPK